MAAANSRARNRLVAGRFGLGECRDRCGGRMIGGLSAGNWVGWAWSLGRGGRDGEGGGGRNFRPDGRWKEGLGFAVIVLELKFIGVKLAYRRHRRLPLRVRKSPCFTS